MLAVENLVIAGTAGGDSRACGDFWLPYDQATGKEMWQVLRRFRLGSEPGSGDLGWAAISIMAAVPRG